MSARIFLGFVSVVVLGLGVGLIAGTSTVSAQVPATEAQAQAIERQLLCPLCTNERLDVCPLEICKDMKRIIRERLAAGSTPDDILLYFKTRYGEKVLAELPATGFNLWLYGWIGLSVLAVGSVGGWFLVRLQRRAAPSQAPSATPSRVAHEDDDWLDEQIAETPPR